MSTPITPAILPDWKISLQLVGIDGNAFSLLGAFARKAKAEGKPEAEIDAILSEAKSGDYDHLLSTLASHCKNNGLSK